MKRHLIVIVCLLTWFCSTHAADLAGAYLYGADLPYAVSPFTKRQAEQHQQAWADYLKTNITIKNSISMKLCLIPPGEFMMGSPESEAGRDDDETQDQVRITKPFYLSATEVTQSQYQQVMGNNPSYSKGANKPVEKVSWNEAMKFCRKLSVEEGVEYRLPTEAEWEYACRAGTTKAYNFGNNVSQLGKYAWYEDNSGNTTHAVGAKLPNAWGLHDMHGNVWEWCQDWYGPYGRKRVLIDPTGPAQGIFRVLRGGSFFDRPRYVRSAYRYDLYQPDDRNLLNGFRLARTCNLSPEATVPTVAKPEARPPTPRKVSPAKPELVASVKNLMTPAQVELGGPVVNGIGVVLVPIPPGEFMMGSPESEADRQYNETQHRVRITKPFYLSATEVTQSQYQQVMGSNPSQRKGPNKPVDMVSWNDAMKFCRRLSVEEGVEYRLPTEAEWEYACRAGTTKAYNFGNNVSQLGKYAWYEDNSGNTTHAVGAKLPNAWGLHDMHGNVWEWCQDWYGPYGRKRVLIDPTGPAQGIFRVLRGGSFSVQPEGVRSAFRVNYAYLPDYRLTLNGFRLARTYNLSP